MRYVLFLFVFSILSFQNPIESKALVPIVNIINDTKELALDAAVKIVTNTIIQSVRTATFNWAAGGDFAGDNGAVLGNYSDYLEEELFRNTTKALEINSNFIYCQSHRDSIDNHLRSIFNEKSLKSNNLLSRNNYKYLSNKTCQVGNDLSVLSNPKQFTWENWLKYTQNPEESELGSLSSSINRIEESISKETEEDIKSLDFNDGFHSIEVCETIELPHPHEICTTETPGSLVHDVLDSQFEGAITSLGTTDEVSELIGTVLQSAFDGFIQGSIHNLKNQGENNSDTSSNNPIVSDGIDNIQYISRILLPGITEKIIQQTNYLNAKKESINSTNNFIGFVNNYRGTSCAAGTASDENKSREIKIALEADILQGEDRLIQFEGIRERAELMKIGKNKSKTINNVIEKRGRAKYSNYNYILRENIINILGQKIRIVSEPNLGGDITRGSNDKITLERLIKALNIEGNDTITDPSYKPLFLNNRERDYFQAIKITANGNNLTFKNEKLLNVSTYNNLLSDYTSIASLIINQKQVANSTYGQNTIDNTYRNSISNYWSNQKSSLESKRSDCLSNRN